MSEEKIYGLRDRLSRGVGYANVRYDRSTLHQNILSFVCALLKKV